MSIPVHPMTPERWQRVDAVLQGALERPAEQRAAYLDETCGDDTALRREVESLLGAASSDDFLERPAVMPSRPRGPDTMTALAAALDGRYRLERELGSGGMASVFLARDVRHMRPVAVKVLHPELTASLGTERFLREIELTASLQHPHLLPLFDSGAAQGLLYYVMPYVEGETLRERLEREGPLPVDEALRLAREIADALAYAHARGIVHRDIKPDNLLLQSGHALVADFGIALAVEQAGGDRMTKTGLSLGTPQYMAPEQASGEKAVDARADVYALGAVLYEMLAGEPPFTGTSARSIVAKVMHEPPRPVRVLRHTVPAHVESAVSRALEKLPADRFPSATAFAEALAAPAPAPTVPAAAPVRTSDRRMVRWETIVAVAVIAFALGATIGGVYGWQKGRASLESAAPPMLTGERTRFAIEVDSGSLGTYGPAIAPDGRTVVFTIDGPNGTQLYSRRLDELSARPIAGTEGGVAPFLSPDGAWVGFFSGGTLRKVRLEGGAAIVLAKLGDAVSFGGGSWGANDTIYFAVPSTRTLYRVAASGGAPQRIALSDSAVSVHYPRVLPSGRSLLVTLADRRIAVVDLASGWVRPLGPGFGARFANGNIVFAGEGGDLYRQPFDEATGARSGSPERIAGGAAALTDGVAFDVAPTGALVYRSGGGSWGSGQLELALVDRTGRTQQRIAARMPWTPRFSPDGRQLVFGGFAPGSEVHDLWIADLGAGTTRRFTSDENNNNDAAWSPDGRTIAYSADAEGGTKDLFIRRADGSGPRALVQRPGFQFTTDWFRDGHAVVFLDVGSGDVVGGDQDVWVQPTNGGAARAVVATRAHEIAARVSPDGRWIAYTSDASGRNEVHVQSYPTPDRRAIVSVGGGQHPAWRGDGRELYYWQDDRLIAARVDVIADGNLVVRDRSPLFRAPYPGGVVAMYDVAPDGNRFALVRSAERSNRMVVVLDAVR